MADNTQLNAGTGGDLIRDIAKTVNAGAKTQGMLLDIGGGTDASPELFLTAGQALKAASLPVTLASDQGALAVSGTFYQATQPVSVAALPLPGGASQDGTDATGVTAPTGGVGIRGWLSGIYNKLLGILSVQLTSAFTPTASSGAFTTSATASTSAQVLPANASRRFFLFSNLGTATIYLNLSGGAASATAGVPVAVNASLFLDAAVTNSQINSFSASASQAYYVVEG
ncbi:MAG: hypothetical protein ACYC4K_09010 [Thiobacillus sp.]